MEGRPVGERTESITWIQGLRLLYMALCCVTCCTVLCLSAVETRLSASGAWTSTPACLFCGRLRISSRGQCTTTAPCLLYPRTEYCGPVYRRYGASRFSRFSSPRSIARAPPRPPLSPPHCPNASQTIIAIEGSQPSEPPAFVADRRCR